MNYRLVNKLKAILVPIRLIYFKVSMKKNNIVKRNYAGKPFFKE
jgi:hypothetical protein